jgi:GTPase Era involved in 16S rRNA processing
MKQPVQSLQAQLDEVAALLDRGPLFSLTGDESRSLQDQTRRISEKLASIQASFLTVGLLGGTGVGKSTLMNALARSEIASASHRRPHTDQALIYRHVRADLPSTLALSDLPWRDITHEVDSIRQIILCDLPDFDSLMGEHRQYVLDFLEHLDVLIWVTSPEKYADGNFYEFLQMVPKATQNFYFVLNKADLLFNEENLETGYQRLSNVTAAFEGHIQGKGLEEPLIYTISAHRVQESDSLPPWNQLAIFRHTVFQRRDFKHITAIKAGNLDVEVSNLVKAFQKEVRNLEAFAQILDTFIGEVEDERPQWIEAGLKSLDHWLGKDVRQEILLLQRDPSLLVGPGYPLALFFEQWNKGGSGQKVSSSDPSSYAPPAAVMNSFQTQLEWLDDRLNHRILHQSLPSAFRQQLQEILNIPRSLEGLGKRFSHIVAARVANPSLPSHWGFRIWQLFIYGLLLAIFLLAIGGETAWRNLLKDPGGTSVFQLFLSAAHTLFSSKGLAALVSYALLNLFVAFRFYGRYRRLLLRSAQTAVDSLKGDLEEVWEEALNVILKDLNQFKGDIQSHISAISVLREDGA